MDKAAGLARDDVDGATELQMELEFDAALMDAVVAHWTPARIKAERR